MTRPHTHHGKKADLKLTLVLGGAVLGAIALAIVASRPPAASGVRSEEPSAALTALPTPADDAPATDTAPLNGQAEKFSPLDIPELTDDIGLPPGHPDLGTAAPLGSVADSDPLPPGHPDIGDAASPHAGLAAPSNDPPHSDQPARPVASALGGNAHVISELTAQRQQLVGQRVRVRAQVTKVTPDVNGRAFFHVRDSSVGGDAKTVDLVATAVVPPKLGEVAIFEGTLRTDVDVGIGYKYPVLLEDATIVGR